MDESPQTVTVLQNFVAGWVAASAARTVASPMETVRLQLQCSDDPEDTVMSVMRRMYAADGPAAFWRGNLAGIARIPLYSYSQFLVVQLLHWLYRQRWGMEPTGFANWWFLICGGEIATAFTAPLDTVKTRLQFLPAVRWGDFDCPLCYVIANVKHAWGCFKAVATKDGLKGLFAGLWPALLGHVPQAATRWTTQRYLPRLLRLDAILGDSPLAALLVGCLTLAIAETLWMPLDTARRRQQRGGLPAGQGSIHAILRGLKDRRGFRGLWSGAGANLLRIGPYNAAMVHTYDLIVARMVQ